MNTLLPQQEQCGAAVLRYPSHCARRVGAHEQMASPQSLRCIWEASTIRRTKAMAQTPRRVLEERASLGNWRAFPESPAPDYAALKSAVGQGYYDYRGTAIVVLSLETAAARCMAPSASDLQRLAIMPSNRKRRIRQLMA